MGVRARARVARRRHAQGALRAVHRRQGRAASATAGRSPRSTRRPRSRWPRSPGRPPPTWTSAVRAARSAFRRSLGRTVGQGAREVPLPDRPDPPGAVARVRGPRVDGLRQADQGVARRRRAARRGALLVLRRLGGQARVRVPGPRREAARRRRPDHPVELPAADARLEDRAGARRRQHGRPQARVDDAAQSRSSSPTSAARPTCRPASSTSSRGRARSGWRSSPIPASTRSRSRARPRSAGRSSRASPAPTRA